MDPYIQRLDNKLVKTNIVADIKEYNARVNKLLKDKTNLGIFHVNIRSIAKNLDELNVFLHQFERKFDIIVLTETFKLPDITLFALPGYSMLYNWGEINRNDGVIVYMRENVKFDCEITEFGNMY